MHDPERWFRDWFPVADPDAGRRIGIFLEELEQWNQRINLTGISRDQWMDRIVAESAVLATLVPSGSFGRAAWMDMGTGAGIPGLIIASMFPGQRICLVDSRGKKTDFIRHAAARMNLPEVEIISDRLESIPKSRNDLNHAISVFFSRALGAIPDLAAYAEPMAAPGAILISPRGGTEKENEIQCLPKKGRKWTGCIVSISVPGFERRLKCAKLFVETS